ncbi:hypothetical protein [Cellulomonas sp. NPDC089187]|uniref:hypothetical protein n=1 Tax=Cellulomonas sp. NPDC089187 TaxID=3154970 RepID=UPI00343500C5
MHATVLDQITRLGGSAVTGRLDPLPEDRTLWSGLTDRRGGSQGGPVVDALLGVRLPDPLQPRLTPTPWSENGLDAILDPVADTQPELLDEDEVPLVDPLMKLVFSGGPHWDQPVWDPWVFAPFTPGSATHGALDGLTTEDELRALVGIPTGEPVEFVMLTRSQAYPTFYVAAAADPHPDDPRVFGTDFTEFFSGALDSEGTLSEFLAGFATAAEFREQLIAAGCR